MQLNRYTLLSLITMTALITGLYLYKPVTVRDISTVEGFVSYARSFGSIMPLAVFFVTIVQAIVPLIPFVILCSANGIIFGLFKGTLLTWVATLLGASITFYVSRMLGYERAEKTYKKANLKYFGRIEGYRGFLMILVLRLLPYFPAPLINISAGVSRISYPWFLLASALGKLPFIIGYGLLGYSILNSGNYTLGIALMAGLIGIPYLVVRFRKKRILNDDKEDQS